MQLTPAHNLHIVERKKQVSMYGVKWLVKDFRGDFAPATKETRRWSIMQFLSL